MGKEANTYRRGLLALVACTSVAVLVLARPYAGSWNDGSRLATVESLVDQGTFAIDASIYVQPPLNNPYRPGDELLAQHGTKDKLFINGHYYSDKSPVPAVAMAAIYQVYRWCGGATAAENPQAFTRLMVWFFAGLPFVLGVWAIGRTMQHMQVPAAWGVGLTASFALGTSALAYAQQVNSHILLLGVAAVLAEALLRPASLTGKRAAWIGLLTGFGYTIDLGTGPALLLGVGLWMLFQPAPRAGKWFCFGVGVLPGLVLHHGLTYVVAGTLGPANAHPEFFQWPGSPFNSSNMTGVWNHASLGSAILYALDLLVGKKGFLLHNPGLLLAVLSLPWWWMHAKSQRLAIVALGAWAIVTWLLYAATSRNLSGLCLTVRWFIPLLVPGYVALGVFVRAVPKLRSQALFVLTLGGLLAVETTLRGPWAGSIPKVFWPMVGVLLMGWGYLAWPHAKGLSQPIFVPTFRASTRWLLARLGIVKH